MEVFDQLAQQYQGEHSTNPHQTALSDRIGSLIPAGSSVLDLGCGTGVPTAKIFSDAGHRVVGVDIAEGMLAMAREQVPGAEFVRADFSALPADYGSFDAVTAFFSLLMLSRAQIVATLEKASGWVKPGGYLAVGMVNFDGDSVPVEFMGVPVTVSGYAQNGLQEVLEAAGFTVTEISTVEFTPEHGPTESQIFALCQKPA